MVKMVHERAARGVTTVLVQELPSKTCYCRKDNGKCRRNGRRERRCKPLPKDFSETKRYWTLNHLNPELNPICYLLALLARHFLHVSRIRVKSLTIRLLMSYIYMEHPFLMFLDHTQRRSTVGRTPLDE